MSIAFVVSAELMKWYEWTKVYTPIAYCFKLNITTNSYWIYVTTTDRITLFIINFLKLSKQRTIKEHIGQSGFASDPNVKIISCKICCNWSKVYKKTLLKGNGDVLGSSTSLISVL